MQKLVCSWPVGVKATPVASRSSGKRGSLEIRFTTSRRTRRPHDRPRIHRLFSALRVPWILPVEIRLFWCKEMQIVLLLSACQRHALPPNFERQLFGAFLVRHRARYKTGGKGFLCSRLAKPGMLGRGMVKHHIENERIPRDFACVTSSSKSSSVPWWDQSPYSSLHRNRYRPGERIKGG